MAYRLMFLVQLGLLVTGVLVSFEAYGVFRVIGQAVAAFAVGTFLYDSCKLACYNDDRERRRRLSVRSRGLVP